MKTILTSIMLLAGMIVSFGQQAFPVGNSSLTNSRTIYAAPLKLFTVSGYNASPSLLYVQIFGTVTNATNGATPLYSLPVNTTNWYSFDFTAVGLNLDACKVCVSSNATTLTLTPSNTTSIQATIKAPQ